MKKQGYFFFVFIAIGGLLACRKDCEMMINEDTVPEHPSTEFIAVLGDIQYYTNSTYIGLYQHTLDWLQTKMNNGWRINCLLHTGDITMTNNISEWSSFYKATNHFAQSIPFISMIGDHDYTWEDGIHIMNRNSTLINDYVQFPLTTEKVVAWFEEGKMENIVVKNTIFGQRLDLLVLEFGPRKEVIDWADKYVKSHPNDLFVLMNHEYLEKGGGRRVTNLKCVSRLRNTSFFTPSQLWDSLVKCNDNIRVVLCGHVGGLYALTIESNDYGRGIPQIQHNIQSPDYRYDNWLMLWEFPADSDSANVFIYNTQTERFFNDQRVLFKFNYRDSVKIK